MEVALYLYIFFLYLFNYSCSLAQELEQMC